MKTRSLNRLLMIALPLLTAGVIAWILFSNWEEIIQFPWRLNWKYLAIVLLFHVLAVAATFWAFQLMVARLGGYRDWRGGFRIYYLSILAKRLPTSLPAIGGRLVMYGQVGVPAAAVLNCILLETLLIGLGGVLVFLVFQPFYSIIPPGVALPLFAAGVLLFVGLLVRPQLFIDFTNWALKRLNKQGLTQAPGRSDIVVWVLVYSIPWLLSGVAFYYLPRAVSGIEGPGFFDALGITTLATLASLLSLILPGGLGLKEFASTALLTPWMPISTALIISLMYRLLQTGMDIAFALIALLIPSPEAALPPSQPATGAESPIKFDQPN